MSERERAKAIIMDALWDGKPASVTGFRMALWVSVDRAAEIVLNALASGGLAVGGTQPPQEAARRWLKPDDAAHHIGVSSKTLANWRWAGKGPRFYKAAHSVLYDRDELDAWVRSNGEGS